MVYKFYAPWCVFTTLNFFVTYEWVQLARAFLYTRLKRLCRDKHSSLVSPYVRKEENNEL